jgi:D-aminopeptidase
MGSDSRPFAAGRPRPRALGFKLGTGEPGPRNAITDVEDVRVGHVTLYSGEVGGDGPIIRTGVTAVLPHGGNLFRDKVPAAAHVINGFGKAVGVTQIQELGVLETPIVLTNTLSVGVAFDGLVEQALRENGEICRSTGSVNPVVAECNDWLLNDIRGRHVRLEHVLAAIETAAEGDVAEGVVGAGTGMVCYGWKGGIGSASRVLAGDLGGNVVGALVLANFGRAEDLRIGSVPVGQVVTPPRDSNLGSTSGAEGSCVMIIATDAPASARQLGRVARRGQSGLARTGSFSEHGSGEYVFAFSTAATIPHWPEKEVRATGEAREDGPLMDALFEAAAEAVEEAIVNALFTAETVSGVDGFTAHALPTAVLEVRSR